MTLHIPNLKRVKPSLLVDVFFICYMCIPFIMFPFQWIGLDSQARGIALVITCTPLFLYYLLKKKVVVPDFWLIFVGVCLFFALTYLLHPEYEEWYTRSVYGVIPYVLRPDNGIFIYLAIRMIDDPKRILKCIKISGWPMYLIYGRQLLTAVRRGYWLDSSNYGYQIQISYNLSFGYDVLIYALVFLYCALESRKFSDWVGASIGLGMIVAGGSRGPFLDIAIFVVLYLILKLEKSKKKIWIILGVSIGAVVLLLTYEYILLAIAAILNTFNISSRFITKMLQGSIADTTSRNEIWAAAINMIKENPFGYGAMGSRHVISQFIYVAHPHQIFLELLIDFGVFFGSLIIVGLGIMVIKILTMKGIPEWKGLFVVFFARACQLLISLTFWHSIGLWSVLAIGVCIFSYERKRRRIENHG